MSDPRFTIHGVTTQGVPPTQPNPKKRLSHTVKAVPSAPIDGAFMPIVRRMPIVGILTRRGRRK